MTLKDLVEDFLKNKFRCNSDGRYYCEVEFAAMRSVEQSIEIACRSIGLRDKKHPHQYRIPPEVLEQLSQDLLIVAEEVASSVDFDMLHAIVERHCERIHGAGPLLAYDVALRIAEGFLKLSPKFVYLHAGAKDGASYLGVVGIKQPLSAFPPQMQKMTPAQAEDFLCICKDRLARLATSSQ